MGSKEMRELAGLLRRLRLAIEAEGRTATATEAARPPAEELIAAPAWAFATRPAADACAAKPCAERLAA